MHFNVDTTSHLDTTTIAAAGEIDLGTADDLRRALTAAVDARRDHVVVDFTGVSYIDSVGLGVLVGAYRRLSADGRTLTVHSVQPRLLKLFSVTGLAKLLAITPTADVAPAVS